MAEQANASTPWHQTDLPMLQDVAVWLGVAVDELRGLLLNQRIYAAAGDRVDPDVILAALDRETAAGRWFPVSRLQRVNVPR